MNGAHDNGSGTEPQQQLFSEAELAELFLGFAGYDHVALAVSGGCDSTAMMLLVRRWLDLTAAPTKITVLTVDHGLRAESASEAEWVASRAAELGFEHRTLTWRGEKPSADLQAAAREARYSLMTGYCREHGIGALATAHTGDDQAETLIMRLRRGSGLDGLAGMAEISERDGIALIRPLLAVSRARLEELLTAAGQSWLDDPSNRNGVYERVRIRRGLKAAAALGLSRKMVTLSARRLGRARAALEAITGEFLEAHLAVGPGGFGEIALEPLLGAQEEIGLRSLARMVTAFGGGAVAPQMSKLEAAYEMLRKDPRTTTLGGCLLTLRGGHLLITREVGRMPRTAFLLQPGEAVIWDRRFSIALPPTATAPCRLTVLDAAGAAAVKAAGGHFGTTPYLAAIALPSLWDDDGLRFAPFVRFAGRSPERWLSGASAEFTGKTRLFRAVREPGGG
jgi:tRNA(Ile)-lysidine synthase